MRRFEIMHRTKFRYVLPALLILALAAPGIGCTERVVTTSDDPALSKPLEELTDQDVARMVAVVETNQGTFKIGLRPDWSPLTARHFIKLVRIGFYSGLSFHEVRKDLWIRGGDPSGDGEGGPGYFFPFEPPQDRKSATHLKGRVGLHHPAVFPDEGGSQFYIMAVPLPALDGSYALFGEVISGMSVIDRVLATPIRRGKGALFYQPVRPIRIVNISLEAKTK